MTPPRLSPGAPLTGFVIAAALAVLAQFGAMGGDAPVWDDATLLLHDERLRSLSSVLTAFGDSVFGGLTRHETYRPLVNASLAVDWFLSGSTPEAVDLAWFKLTNLLLHALNAGLAYLFLAHLTGRKLGAPMLGAALFAVHPLAVEPVAWIVGRGDLLATAFGLAAGILLLRAPARRMLLVPALLCFTLSLFAKASAVMLPVVTFLGVVAYRGLPPRQLLGRRHGPRLAAFAAPIAIWLAARAAVLENALPADVGVAWKEVAVGDRLLGVGRAVSIMMSQIVLPARLCGDYGPDAAFQPALGGLGPQAALGLALLAACVGLGIAFLRSRPKVGFPLLAFALMLVPVLQIVPIGAIVADRFVYLPALFVYLLAGEGLERVFDRVRSPGVVVVTFLLMATLGVLSHVRVLAWNDAITWNRNVLQSYPESRGATQRLAAALSDTGDAADLDESLRLLRAAADRLARPDEEVRILGAILLEAHRDADAESPLRRAVALAGGKPEAGAIARYNLAVLLARTERKSEALVLLDEALERMPTLSVATKLRARLR